MASQDLVGGHLASSYCASQSSFSRSRSLRAGGVDTRSTSPRKKMTSRSWSSWTDFSFCFCRACLPGRACSTVPVLKAAVLAASGRREHSDDREDPGKGE